nr:hypothetical protein [Moritella viscosa]
MTERLIESGKKKRDTRSHDERIQDLLETFEHLKARAEATGSIYQCTVSKVAKGANVNDVYLYKDKLKDPDINKKYHNIRKLVVRFTEDFNKNKSAIIEESALGKAIKDRDEFEVERNAAQLITAKTIHKNLQQQNEIDYFKNRHRETENNAIDIAHARVASKVNNYSNIISFNEPKIICPDDHLKDNNGHYDYSSQTKIDNAWTVAKNQLALEVKKTHIPMRVYLLIGVQNAGKTFWRDNRKNFHSDRQPIVIDATNLTKLSRAEWFLELADIRREIIADNKDIKVCAVYFDVSLMLLQHRNSRRPPEKRIDNEKLAENFAKLEAPTTAERFDEIIIERQNNR